MLSDFLGTELICEARRLQSSWLNPAKDVPFGRTYLIYSWFFSIEENTYKEIRENEKNIIYYITH